MGPLVLILILVSGASFYFGRTSFIGALPILLLGMALDRVEAMDKCLVELGHWVGNAQVFLGGLVS